MSTYCIVYSAATEEGVSFKYRAPADALLEEARIEGRFARLIRWDHGRTQPVEVASVNAPAPAPAVGASQSPAAGAATLPISNDDGHPVVAAAPEPLRWVGPFQVRTMLEQCMDDSQPWPKEQPGIYVVTLRAWQGQPIGESEPLYVGGNPQNPKHLLNRTGFLIKDMLGFFGEETGSHSGGQSLWFYCRENGIHPLDLYLAWAENVTCSRCSEVLYYEKLTPSFNHNRPASCKVHV
jgi:hypothetical protein